jgi:hypothetical protein
LRACEKELRDLVSLTPLRERLNADVHRTRSPVIAWLMA